MRWTEGERRAKVCVCVCVAKHAGFSVGELAAWTDCSGLHCSLEHWKISIQMLWIGPAHQTSAWEMPPEPCLDPAAAPTWLQTPCPNALAGVWGLPFIRR